MYLCLCGCIVGGCDGEQEMSRLNTLLNLHFVLFLLEARDRLVPADRDVDSDVAALRGNTLVTRFNLNLNTQKVSSKSLKVLVQTGSFAEWGFKQDGGT